MLKRFAFLVLIAVTAAGCSTGNDLAPVLGDDGDNEAALVTDADLDAAVFVGESSLRALGLEEFGLRSLPNRATGLKASGQSFSPQSVVPLDGSSQLAYIQQRNKKTRIVLRETRADGRGGGYRQVLVYNSARKVSSVAVSGDAQLLVFAAEANNGNVEVYALDRDGERLGQAGKLVRLTNTEADEADVSMSLAGDVVVWGTEVDDFTTAAFAFFEPRLEVFTLDPGGVNISNPSLSGNGETLVFVADGGDLDVGADVIVTFSLLDESPPVPLYQGDVRDPSVSFAADKLLFVEGNAVTYADRETEELTDLITVSKLEHPFLTSDGLYFTFARNGDIFTRLIDTEAPGDAPQDVVDGSFVNSEPYWAKYDFELRYSASTIDGKTFVRPDDGSGQTAADRTVKYHRYSFVAPVSDRYEIRSEQDFDGYLLLYEGFFNPKKPNLNLVAFNDDFPSTDPNIDRLSRVAFELESGQRYTVVTTAFDSGVTGLFTNVITRNIPPPPPTVTLPAPDNSGYDITLRFVTDNLTNAQKAVFTDAADRWSAIITDDLANIKHFVLPESFSFPNTGVVKGTLDDLLIDVAFNDLDGPGGLLGRAGPRLIRQQADAPLSIYGTMEFDIAEFGDGGFFDDEQQYQDVIVHEMGHVLGIGTLWELTGNTRGIINPGDPGFPDGPPTVAPGAPNPDYDPRFTGSGAVAEYQTLLEAAGKPHETTAPIANTGGPGNYNGHWRELTFGNELMTPYAGGTELLSRMTAASLADVGYTINIASPLVDANYALPLPTTFAQVEPDAITYEEFEDYLAFSGSVGSAEATVQAVDLDLGVGNTSTSGCEAADFADFEAGNIALLQRGTCPFTDKLEAAAAAGATGVVMFNQGDTTDPARTGLFSGSVGSAAVPAVGVPYETGVAFAELAEAGTLVVSLDSPVAGLEAQTLSAAAVKPNFEEELLGPIGTVSPEGTINFFE